MRLILTDKDQKTLNHIEQYGFITIEQCRKMFYNTQSFGYDIARKRLNKLVKQNKIKVARDAVSLLNVFYLEYKPTYHDILVMNFYAELVYSGVKILNYDTKYYWLDGGIISDAFCCFTISNKIYYNIVEVCHTHSAIATIKNYKALYKSGEAQKISNQLEGKEVNRFPRIILIDNVKHRNPLTVADDVDIIQLDFNLSEMSKIFV